MKVIRSRHVRIAALSLLLTLGLAGLIWPTPYRYWTGKQGRAQYRANRVTGRVEILLGDRWYPDRHTVIYSDVKVAPYTDLKFAPPRIPAPGR